MHYPFKDIFPSYSERTGDKDYNKRMKTIDRKTGILKLEKGIKIKLYKIKNRWMIEYEDISYLAKCCNAL